MGEPTGERPWSEATVETNEVRSAAASILSNWGEEANLLALFGAEVGALNGWTGRSSITRSGANRSAAEPCSGSRPGGRRVGLGVFAPLLTGSWTGLSSRLVVAAALSRLTGLVPLLTRLSARAATAAS